MNLLKRLYYYLRGLFRRRTPLVEPALVVQSEEHPAVYREVAGSKPAQGVDPRSPEEIAAAERGVQRRQRAKLYQHVGAQRAVLRRIQGKPFRNVGALAAEPRTAEALEMFKTPLKAAKWCERQAKRNFQ